MVQALLKKEPEAVKEPLKPGSYKLKDGKFVEIKIIERKKRSEKFSQDS